MARLLIVGGFLAAIFWVFSVIDCAAQPATRHRGVSKTKWVLIVLLLPVIGGILWFTIGRRSPGEVDSSLFVPDDHPDVFLSTRRTERETRRAEQDARIKQLEEELARLDDESDGPDTRS